MKFAFPLAVGLVFVTLAAPAGAQMASGMSNMGMGGAGGGPKIQPKIAAPDLAPSGVPGIGGAAPLSTGPRLQKPASGDPTQELFAAINDNNYSAAQDAVSRGANLQATNQFNETPLDLAIALNHNDITFLLLGTRDELAAQGEESGQVMGAPWSLDDTTKPGEQAKRYHHVAPVVSVRVSPKREIPANETGIPDPQAGFLGFGPKS